MTAVLSVERLTKHYGQRAALCELSFTLGAGELVIVAGANGAGKTTCLSLISGQLVPDSGRILVDGHDLQTKPLAARRALSYVAQDLILPPLLSVKELAEFSCQVKGQRLDRQLFDDLAAAFGLTEHRDRLVGELSHGMQRKAAWTIALLTDPKLLIVDEGLAGLDAASASALIERVRRVKADGIAIIWVEHDLQRLAPISDRLLVLRAGRHTESLDSSALLAPTEQLERLMRRITGSLEAT